ncbi:MAG: phosphotransferase, partial [Alphaproteobacteria bacterium]
FLLLEDFGDATFTRLLNQGADAHDLYALAVDALIVLRQRVQLSTLPTLRRLSAPVLLDQVELLTQWYLPLAGGGVPHESAAAAWRAAWTEVLAGRPAEPETLVLYDYHVDNLIRLTDRSAVAACGLLDFQDAVKGPALFDLVSLLRDVRRDVPPDLAQAMQARYRAAFAPMGDGDFDHAAALWALQRNCRILGTFARLCVRDGKPGYLAFLPRVWRLVAEDAAHPALSPVREWLDRHVPPPARHITPPEAGRG